MLNKSELGFTADVRKIFATTSCKVVDRHNVIEPGDTIGFDREADERRGFTVSEGGVTVMPAGRVGYFARANTDDGRGGYAE